MKTLFYSSKPYDKRSFAVANEPFAHEIDFFEGKLDEKTADLAVGYTAICAFVNDQINAKVLEILSNHGVKLIALRCAGFNQIDLEAAHRLQIRVVRVPAYSPYAVAEHTIALLLGLNRKIHRAYNRVREGNFALDGLLGFDLNGKTVGIVGTGKIGAIVARILKGFGCDLLFHDPIKSPACMELGGHYVSLDQLFAEADIVTLHCPLTPASYHLINESTIAQMKDGVTIINTSRGGLIDAQAAIEGLKKDKIGNLGLDVYEEEGDLFFEDLSNYVIKDDVFSRLTTFPNVLISGHQAFFTREALQNIAETTLQNISDIASKGNCENEISFDRLS